MISQTLRKEIDAYASDLRRTSRLLGMARSGAVSKETVGRYLASIHYLVSHTPVHLKLARERAEMLGHAGLAAYFARKLEEEAGHDRWADADIDAVAKLAGRSIERRPSDAMRSLVENIQRGIERDPFLYLAYILFAEYLTVRLGAEWVSALEERCGVPSSAMTVATHHVELDKHHVDDGCREMDTLVRDAALHEPMIAMLHDSMRHFTSFCDDLCSAAA